LNPEANPLVKTCWGILRSVVLFFPVDALITSTSVFGSRPNALPISRASNPAMVPAAPR